GIATPSVGIYPAIRAEKPDCQFDALLSAYGHHPAGGTYFCRDRRTERIPSPPVSYCKLVLPRHQRIQDSVEFVFPVAAEILRFVKNLKTEDVVLEVFSQLLPGDPSPDFIEHTRHMLFVQSVEIAGEVFPF